MLGPVRQKSHLGGVQQLQLSDVLDCWPCSIIVPRKRPGILYFLRPGKIFAYLLQPNDRCLTAIFASCALHHHTNLLVQVYQFQTSRRSRQRVKKHLEKSALNASELVKKTRSQSLVNKTVGAARVPLEYRAEVSCCEKPACLIASGTGCVYGKKCTPASS